jgi:hypothetical protein
VPFVGGAFFFFYAMGEGPPRPGAGGGADLLALLDDE